MKVFSDRPRYSLADTSEAQRILEQTATGQR